MDTRPTVSVSERDKEPDQRYFVLAQTIQDKYETYILALSFTILGLSIQTGHFQAGGIAALCELISWVMLLVSALFGLARWEMRPMLYASVDAQHHFMHEGDQVKAKEELGNMERRARTLGRSYGIQKWTFLVGIISLLFARGYAPGIYVVSIVRSRIGH